MKIDDFFSFGSKLNSSTFQVSAVELNTTKNENSKFYDQHRLITGDYSNIHFPVLFNQESGSKVEDILDTGWSNLYLISNRFKKVLEENELTGWRTYNVRIFGFDDREIFGYNGLSITGRCGKIDYSKSEIFEKQLVSSGPSTKYYKGLHVGLDRWDESDFFLPEGYFGIIITKKTAEILKKNKFTNVRLENISRIEMEDSTVRVALENNQF